MESLIDLWLDEIDAGVEILLLVSERPVYERGLVVPPSLADQGSDPYRAVLSRARRHVKSDPSLHAATHRILGMLA